MLRHADPRLGWSDVAMASVFQRDGTYYVRWKDAAGRWRKQVSSCTTKRHAQRYADDLERKAERQSKGLEPSRIRCLETKHRSLRNSPRTRARRCRKTAYVFWILLHPSYPA